MSSQQWQFKKKWRQVFNVWVLVSTLCLLLESLLLLLLFIFFLCFLISSSKWLSLFFVCGGACISLMSNIIILPIYVVIIAMKLRSWWPYFLRLKDIFHVVNYKHLGSSHTWMPLVAFLVLMDESLYLVNSSLSLHKVQHVTLWIFSLQ